MHDELPLCPAFLRAAAAAAAVAAKAVPDASRAQQLAAAAKRCVK